jgi:cytidine deaminase
LKTHLDENNLIDTARKAMENAYAPYSKIKVGAALLTSSGKIYTGCNIENASYGLTICAERVAVGCAVSQGEKNFIAIAIVNSTEKIITPCGACLQVLSEFSRNLQIILVSAKNEIIRTDLKSLFPEPFNLP